MKQVYWNRVFLKLSNWNCYPFFYILRVVCVSDLALLLGPLQDPLLDGTLTDKAVDSDLLGLTQPVSSVHGLLVYCGVPVTVVEDDLEEKQKKIFTFLRPRCQGHLVKWLKNDADRLLRHF